MYAERVRGCNGDENAGGTGEDGVAMSAGSEYMGGTRGSGVVSSTDDVRGVRGGVVGGVCELCMSLVQGGEG